MLEKYLSSIIVPYLSQFVENLDSKQLNVDLWNGNVVLKDLMLKKSVLEALIQGDPIGDNFSFEGATKAAPTPGVNPAPRLPLTVQRGICKRVNLVVPYTQLRSKPVVMEIGELLICVKGNTECRDVVLSKAAKLDAAAARKSRELEQFEAERRRTRENNANNSAGAAAATSAGAAADTTEKAPGATTGASVTSSATEKGKGKDGYLSRLGELVVNNIVIKVQSVHVRYEDEATKTVAGVILGDVRLFTVDLFTGNEKFVDPVGMRRMTKRLEFAGLQCYCDDPARYELNPHGFFISRVNDMSKWVIAMRERVEEGDVEHSTIVGPVKGHVDVNLILKNFIRDLIWEPYLKVRMRLDSFQSKFNRAQYLTLIRTISLLSNWTSLTEVLSRRPNVPVTGNACAWWRYAIKAVRSVTAAPKRERLLQRISEVCIVDYHVLYRDVVRKTEMSPEKQRAYRFITRFMTVPDMIAGRKYVYAQLANAIQLKRKDTEAKKAEAQPAEEGPKKGGWLSWIRRQHNDPEPQEDEEARALEELEREYGLDPGEANGSDTGEENEEEKLPESYCWFDAQFELSMHHTTLYLSKTQKLDLVLHDVGLLVKTFNAPNSVQVRIVTDNLTLSNPVEDETLRERLPSLVEGLPFRCGPSSEDLGVVTERSRSWNSVPLLECSAALNPVEQPIEDTHLDFTMNMRLLPLRVVADPPTIDAIVRFFHVPKGLDVGYVVRRTKDFALTVGQAASTELRQAMTNTKGYKISLDAAGPHIIFPKTLRGALDEPALAVSLGHAMFDTQPLTETEKQQRLLAAQAGGQNEEWHYYSSTADFSKFFIELGTLGSVLERQGSGFMLVPEIAYSASVLQLIDRDMANNREWLIVRMVVPKLCMACSVGQAHVLSNMVEQWVAYLAAAGTEDDNDPVAMPSVDTAVLGAEKLLAAAGSPGGIGPTVGVGGSTSAGAPSAEGSYFNSCTGNASRPRKAKNSESDSDDALASTTPVVALRTQADLPYVRLHATIEELGISIFEDDLETRQPLVAPRFTMAFRTALMTLHVRTQKQLLEMVLNDPYCLDAREPDHLVIAGPSIHCNAEMAADMPMHVDIVMQPPLKFCLNTSCMELLEAVVDITNLIATTSDAIPQLTRSDEDGVDTVKFERGAKIPLDVMQELQIKQVQHMFGMPDTPVVRMSLRIAGIATVELMERCVERQPSQEQSAGKGERQPRDYPIAYATFKEVNLFLRKNSVTMEVNGSVQQVEVSLSEVHDVSPSNRVVLQRRVAPPHASPIKSKVTEPLETGATVAVAAMSPGSGSGQLASPQENLPPRLQSSESEQRQHLTFTYRTSRPVMPIFQTGADGKRKLTNVSELRFSGFAELEFSSSDIHLDIHSVIVLSQYFCTGLFAELSGLSLRTRYDGRVPAGPSLIEPPQLLTSVRVFAQDLTFNLPVDARVENDIERFRVSVDHVAVQSSLLSAEEKQSMNISLREIRLLHGFPHGVDAERMQSAAEGKVLMPTTSLDVSLKSPLDQLSDEPLRVELRGDELVLALTEGDIVDLCRLISGNLTRAPPPPPPAPPRLQSLTGSRRESSEVGEARLPSVAACSPQEITEAQSGAHVVWRAGRLTLSLLDTSSSGARFRLEGNGFTFDQRAPGGELSLRWDKLELHDVYEETCRATMLLCGCGRVELGNLPAPWCDPCKGANKEGMNDQVDKINATTGDGTSSVDFEDLTPEQLHQLLQEQLNQPQDSASAGGLSRDFVDIQTLVVDFTLERFAVSDQWLAVYDFVCNQAVVEALQHVASTDDSVPPRRLCQGFKEPSEGMEGAKPFRCIVTTRAVNVPFLTISREEFLEADITSLHADVITYLNTTTVTVRMHDLVVRHSASGERVLFKKHDTDDLHLSSFDNTQENLLLTGINSARSPRTPAGGTTTAPAAALTNPTTTTASPNQPVGTATPDILNLRCHIGGTPENPQQRVRIAVGELATLFSAPLVAQIVEYCAQPDQPIAKISNLGVMREQRERLARAADQMVNNGAINVQVLWQQPCIIFAGNAQELANKSRNIEAHLGLMGSEILFDKRSGSCTVSTKVVGVSIPEMLEETTVRLRYKLEERNADISVVVDKATALLHPVGVEKLLWVIQWNLMVPPDDSGNSVANNVTHSGAVAGACEKEGIKEPNVLNERKEQVVGERSTDLVEEPITQNIHVEASSIVLAMHDVLGLHVHTTALGGLKIHVNAAGDVDIAVKSVTTVEHFTNQRLMEACGEGALTVHVKSAEKTTSVCMAEVNFRVVPKAVGSLLNMLLSVQLPPPLPSVSGVPTTVLPSETGWEHRLSVRLNCCRTLALHDGQEVFLAEYKDLNVDLCSFADASSTLTVSIGWLVVQNLYSKKVKGSELMLPMDGEENGSPAVIDFVLTTSPPNNRSVTRDCDCAAAPCYVQQLRCRISSFLIVSVPDVTYAAVQVTADILGNISDVNRGKAYDYVAEKTAQQIRERQQLTEVEVAIGRPCIKLLDAVDSQNVVEVFLGDFVVRNKLRCAAAQGSNVAMCAPHAEVFSLSINRLSLNILGGSAFNHSSSIEVEFSRLITDDVIPTVASDESVGVPNDEMMSLNVSVPMLSARLTEAQLNTLLDVVGAFSSFGCSPPVWGDSCGAFPSSHSQGASGHHDGSMSATSFHTSSVVSPSGGAAGKRRAKDPLLGLQVQGAAHGCGLPTGDVNVTAATADGAITNCESVTNEVSTSMKISAVMQRLVANIDDKFEITVDHLTVEQVTTSRLSRTANGNDNSNAVPVPPLTNSNSKLFLEGLVIRHCSWGSFDDNNERASLFASRDVEVASVTVMSVNGNSRETDSSTTVRLGCLHTTITPQILVDARNILYGPFCMKVARTPLSPIPICRLTDDVYVLKSNLSLDPTHILITGNKSRCSYVLDLNQYKLCLLGPPAPHIVLDDNCELTITNGCIVVPGMYALSSFVSFGGNASVFTTKSCVIEKIAHHDRVVAAVFRPVRRRSRGGVESTAAPTHKNMAAPSVDPAKQPVTSIQPPQQQPQVGAVSLNSTSVIPQCQSNIVPRQASGEEVRSTVSVECKDVMLRVMAEEAEDIGVCMFMALDFTTTRQLDDGVLKQNCAKVTLRDIRTSTRDEVALQPSTFTVAVAGTDRVSVTGSLASQGLCLRVSLVRSLVELVKDTMSAFTHEGEVPVYPVNVVLEDENLKPLVDVPALGECRICEMQCAKLATSEEGPGVLCYRCCTGKMALPETNVWFAVDPVDILLLSDSGGMLQLRCVAPFETSYTADKGLHTHMKLQVRNLNDNAAVWEPLVEHITMTFGGDVRTSAYWIKVEKFDYVLSPMNVKLLRKLSEDFSPTSELQRQLRRKFRGNGHSLLQTDDETLDEVGGRDTSAEVAEGVCDDGHKYVAYVEVHNYFSESLEFDGLPIEPRGRSVATNVNKNYGTLRRTHSVSSVGVTINWFRSPLYVRYPDMVVRVQTTLSHREGSKRLFRVVSLRCYPVHRTDMIICLKNNVSTHVEVVSGVPAVGPQESFYFHPDFSLDRKLQLRPVQTVDEEYTEALAVGTGAAPTLSSLLSASSTTLHSRGVKRREKLFVFTIHERQEDIWAGTPMFVISIEPHICIENNLPCSVRFRIHKDGPGKQNLFSSVVKAAERADVIQGETSVDRACFHFEVHHEDKDSNGVIYSTPTPVKLKPRTTHVVLRAQLGDSRELRINVRCKDNKIVLSTPYSIVNFAPLPIELRECSSSGVEIPCAGTNFRFLPKQMKSAYPASPQSADAREFFVNVHIMDYEARAIPLHVQDSSAIVLGERMDKGSAERGTSNRGPILFHLMCTMQVDMYGSRFVTIVPRWTIVNRTPRDLYVAQALLDAAPPGSSSSGKDTRTVGGVPDKVSGRCFRCRYDIAQHIPPNSSTPLFVTARCCSELGYAVFVLADKGARVYGNPVSLEEVASELVVAHGVCEGGEAKRASVVVETSVVVDGPYTFFTVQDLPVSPYILLNRTPLSLELHGAHGHRLARVGPGCSTPFVMNPRDKPTRTRITLESGTWDTTATADVGEEPPKWEGEHPTPFVEFDFDRPMRQEERYNELDIEYVVGFGPFGQQIVELKVATSAGMCTTRGAAGGGVLNPLESDSILNERSLRVYQPPPPTPLDVVMNLSYVTCSLVTMDQEILLVAIEDVRCHVTRKDTKETVNFTVKNIQIDNQCEEKPVYEVCLVAIRAANDVQCISAYVEREIVPARALLCVNQVCLNVVPIAVRLSDNVLVAIASFGAQLTVEQPMRAQAPTEQELFDNAPVTVGAMNTRVILRCMVVNPLEVRVWFEREAGGHDFIREHVRVRTAALLSMMIQSCEDVHINLPGLNIERRSGSAGVLWEWLLKVYWDKSYTLMAGLFYQYASSLPLIGAPIKLFSGFGAGALKFFQEPVAGLQESPKAFARGLAAGSAALLRETAGGGLGAVSNLAKTGASIIDVFGDGSRTSSRSGGAGACVLHGLASGVKGVVNAPVEGATQGGARGLLFGMGKGALGLVTKPVAGLLADVSRLTGTAARACDSSHLPKVRRRRGLREFHANGAVAERNSLLTVFEYERGEHDGSKWTVGSESSWSDDKPQWLPCTKEQMQRKQGGGPRPDMWQVQRYGTNFEGWKYSKNYHGKYTREQLPRSKVRRRRWVSVIRPMPTSAILRLVHIATKNPTCTSSSDSVSDGVFCSAQLKHGSVSSATASSFRGSSGSPADDSFPGTKFKPESPKEAFRTVVLYEYEAKVVFVWSSRVLPQGRSPWEDSEGCRVQRRSDYNPPHGWSWDSDWFLSRGAAGPDGWEYVGKESHTSTELRRRCWKRRIRKVL
ncbi:N-terminal region of Chorein, a TM vesicle-mediated sorter/Integral peroxisomal membrane peroxin, putative [Trypanosoma equiperdum]|uniref:N-terminal region of Chorein, a TM vesicle-mediated sorter/Integral peroxisomal membrane peroxin, putative n=1 Tax=Trypanosoma equiperdum TaxID=5694 RepID=A0A1G4I600_TRYEQ|nr:N-terminal region of Chorein, a TM vesicle-mediated sorter/Integral peroxisomal membrane peroxin, putative [Trypanosoma equiperdum]